MCGGDERSGTIAPTPLCYPIPAPGAQVRVQRHHPVPQQAGRVRVRPVHTLALILSGDRPADRRYWNTAPLSPCLTPIPRSHLTLAAFCREKLRRGVELRSDGSGPDGGPPRFLDYGGGCDPEAARRYLLGKFLESARRDRMVRCGAWGPGWRCRGRRRVVSAPEAARRRGFGARGHE